MKIIARYLPERSLVALGLPDGHGPRESKKVGKCDSRGPELAFMGDESYLIIRIRMISELVPSRSICGSSL